jgi:hypothetical protein
MNSDYIKMCVAHYFRYAKGCPLVTLEYWHQRDACVQPDVLVLDKKKRLIEIEVKISLSDFKADAKKQIWEFRNLGMRWPWKFYYAVPISLAEKVRPILPEGVGLLRIEDDEWCRKQPQRAVTVAESAPPHKECEIVDDARYERMVSAQSAALCCALRKANQTA